MTPIDLARAVHAVSILQQDTVNGCKQGAPWDTIDTVQRDRYIALVTLYLTETISDAKSLHLYWMQEMVRDGWRWCAQMQPDTNRKLHPYLCDWDLLPTHEKLAYSATIGIVEELGCWLR